MYRDIPEELKVLIEPVVRDAGFELVDALLTRGRAPWLLRVTVDTPEADGRVSIERCAAVSREIGSQLDAADAIAVAYRLEVSSPGLDRALKTETDYRRFVGKLAKLSSYEPIDGRRHWTGRLLSAADGIIEIALEKEGGAKCRIPFAKISHGRLEVEF